MNASSAYIKRLIRSGSIHIFGGVGHTGVVRIVQISDIHAELSPAQEDKWKRLEWAIHVADNAGAQAIIVTGDLAAQEGSIAVYRRIKRYLDTARCDVLVQPGNHDDRTLFATVWGRRYQLDPLYPTLDRRIDVGGERMVLLDTSDGRVTDQQVAWLDVVCATHAASAIRAGVAPRFVIWSHHPVIGGFHRYMDANYPLEGRDKVLSILSRYAQGLEIAIFSGHYHTAAHVKRDGIHQFCCPSLLQQLDATSERISWNDEPVGVRIVDLVHPSRIESTITTMPVA